jgi:tRNA (cytidine/uridine-2'-O-)-methyltransferase
VYASRPPGAHGRRTTLLHVILYQPEIPPNTGNIMRLCANSGALLHLIEPLGFTLDQKKVRRAGLDYRDLAAVYLWKSLQECLHGNSIQRWFAVSTRGSTRYDEPHFVRGDALVFGPETRGLPTEVLDLCPLGQRLRIPMQPDNRSLNLSNAVAVIVYEAWRQSNFTGSV